MKLVRVVPANWKQNKKKILELVGDCVLTAKILSEKVFQELALSVPPKRLRRLLRQAGYRWKRLRNSLKSKRDEGLFRLFQQELQSLIELEDQGEIDLLFFDESGFNLHPNVPYGWQPRGETAELPASRGTSISVIGAFSRKHQFEGAYFQGAINSQMVCKMIDRIASNTKQKTILILDNASIHTAECVKDRIPEWKKQNLFLQFIPAYSPELNLIEILWKNIKHFWLPHTAYRDKDTLTKQLEHIFDNLGSKYQITFG